MSYGVFNLWGLCVKGSSSDLRKATKLVLHCLLRITNASRLVHNCILKAGKLEFLQFIIFDIDWNNKNGFPEKLYYNNIVINIIEK